MGFFDKLRGGLRKTREMLLLDVGKLLRVGRRIDETLLVQLEERLLKADAGRALSTQTMEKIRAEIKRGGIGDAGEIMAFLRKILTGEMDSGGAAELARNPDGPTVVLMVGVNGVGKTTTTAKLAKFLMARGEKVMLAAADTFRAAAGEQLSIWAGRIGADVVRHADGSDPSAVIFDACGAALARGAGYVLVDTAGRIHTRANLMQQLEKMRRVAGKRISGAPHEVLLVLDATVGQNAISQAKVFAEGVGVTGLVLAKLDGTAKGGAAMSIKSQLGLPVKFIGVGEGEDDIAPFDAGEFAAALFEETGPEKPERVGAS